MKRFDAFWALALVLVVAAAPLLAGVIISGSGTASSSSTNGYGDPSSSSSNTFGLPSSAGAFDSNATGNGNSTGSGFYSLTSSTDINGVVTVTASANSSAFAQDFNEGSYTAAGGGNLAASIQLTSMYDYTISGSGSAASAANGTDFGAATLYSTQSASSSIDFNGNSNGTTGGGYGLFAFGNLGPGTYGLTVDANSAASVGDFWNASSSGNSEAFATLTLTPVPEPSSMFVLGAGLLSVAVFSWCRRTKQSPVA